ncbi:hypothetical protein [Streptomyces globisporus]|uniref:hypothetical protein n=1 Tax=Streptomyces globisporus TaxID=1908 RepID=UPI0038088914
MRASFDRPEPRLVPPGEYPLWDEALAPLNRDLGRTVAEHGPLRLLTTPPCDEGEPECVYVALANGEWHGNPLYPDSAENLAVALVAIADVAQETITERLRRAWPLCTEHDLGVHPREADGRLSWWCAGERRPSGGAHIRAAVGELDALLRPRRPNRKRRNQN